MEFQSNIGIALYQTLKANSNDIEGFKKTASFILRDHYKTRNNQNVYKNKNFPP